jgi:hypothetical protein
LKVTPKAKQAGWDRLVNGELLNAAETTGFDLFVIPDKNMRYRQNLKGGKNRNRRSGQCAMACVTEVRW